MYDLNAKEIDRAGFGDVNSADDAVGSVWKNAKIVLDLLGEHKPVLFLVQEDVVLMIAVAKFFESAEARTDFMQFLYEIVSTREGVEGVVLVMETQYLEVGMIGGEEAVSGQSSLIVMSEWHDGGECAWRADLEVGEDGKKALSSVPEVEGRGLHEFGGVFSRKA